MGDTLTKPTTLNPEDCLHCMICTQARGGRHLVGFPDCNHCFCKTCLVKHHQMAHSCVATDNINTNFTLENYEIRCPACPDRDPVQGCKILPMHGDQVKASHQVFKLLSQVDVEASKIASTQGGEHRCQTCPKSKSKAQWVCVKCRKEFCPTCYAKHEELHGIQSMDPNRTEHITVKIKKYKVTFRCKKHKREVEHYCKKCDVIVCEGCLKDRRFHGEHDTMPFEDILQRQYKELPTKVEDIQRQINHRNQQKELTKKLLEIREKEFKKAKLAIERQTSALMKQIGQVQEQLVNKLTRYYENCKILHNNHNTYLDYTMSLLNRLQYFVQELTQAEHEAVVLLHNHDLKQFINGFSAPVIESQEQMALKELHTVPKFTAMMAMDQQGQIKLGELSYDSIPPITTVTEPIPTNISLMQPPVNKLWTKTWLSGEPHGLMFTQNGDILVADYRGRKVTVCDGQTGEDGGLGRAITDDGQNNSFFPHDLAVDPQEGILYVTDDQQKRIKGFDRDGNRRILGEYNRFSAPSGISLDSSHRYLVVSDTLNHNITILDKRNGRFVRHFGKEGNGKKEFHVPEFLLVTDDDRIVVSDRENNRIVTYSMDGKYISEFGESGKGQGQFDAPMGICQDQFKNILVADSNNQRICRFKPDGTFIGYILEFPIGSRKPYGIAVNEDGRLAITDKATREIDLYEVQWTR